jgi:hypothetical protein
MSGGTGIAVDTAVMVRMRNGDGGFAPFVTRHHWLSNFDILNVYAAGCLGSRTFLLDSIATMD